MQRGQQALRGGALRGEHALGEEAGGVERNSLFQPGSGAHARLYFVLGGLLARRGYQFLGVDRPGHGLSAGPRGDCTVEEAIAVAEAAMDHARSRWAHPVVLMGSSMGGC